MAVRPIAIGAAIAMLYAMPSSAAVLVSGTGWQSDTIPVAGAMSEKSAWNFTITAASILSLTDAFIPGDVYTLDGDISGSTSFYAGSAAAVQATGSYGRNWTSALYSKFAVSLAPGTYSFTITGDGAGGAPSLLGLRLDVSAVPEPATWAMLALGFGTIGMALRRRRRCLHAPL